MSIDYSKLSNKTLLALKNKEKLDYSSMSNDELLEIQKMSKPQQTKVEPQQDKQQQVDPSQFESFLRGAAQGASFGFADEATGALESLISDKTYEQARDESRANYKAAEEANPMTSLAGNLAGGIAVPIPGGMGKNLYQVVGKGAAMGALGGLGASEAEKPKDLVGDIALGASLGGAGAAALKGAEKLIKGGASLASKALGGDEAAAAFKYGLQGENLVGKENRLRVGKELTDAAAKAGTDIQDEIVNLAKQQGALLEKATNEGKTADISSIINDFLIPKMEQLPKSLTQESDTARKGIIEPIVRATQDAGSTDAIMDLVNAGKLSELTKGEMKLSPKEMNNLSKTLSDLTFTKDIKDKDVSKLAKQLGIEAGKLTDTTVEGLSDVNSKIHALRNAQEIMKLGKDVNELGNTVALTPLVQKLESETLASDIARAKVTEAVDQLKKGSPELADKFTKELTEKADKFTLTNELNKPVSMTVNPMEMVRRVGRQAANIAGNAARDGLNMDDQTLSKIAEKVSIKNTKLGGVVNKLIGQDDKKKQAIMFTLMQQPAFREAINDGNDKED